MAGGGGVRGRSQVCVPKTGLPFRVPLINVTFFLQFLMWVGRPAGSPPPSVGGSLGNGLPSTHGLLMFGSLFGQTFH